jgi:hypothetical protein
MPRFEMTPRTASRHINKHMMSVPDCEPLGRLDCWPRAPCRSLAGAGAAAPLRRTRRARCNRRDAVPDQQLCHSLLHLVRRSCASSGPWARRSHNGHRDACPGTHPGHHSTRIWGLVGMWERERREFAWGWMRGERRVCFKKVTS